MELQSNKRMWAIIKWVFLSLYGRTLTHNFYPNPKNNKYALATPAVSNNKNNNNNNNKNK